MRDRWGERPFVAIVFAFVLGIACSLFCKEYCFISLVASNVALICAAFISLHRDRYNLSLLLGLSAILVGGLLIALARRDAFSRCDLRSLLPQGAFLLDEPVLFKGCVVEISEKRGWETLLTVELHGFFRKELWISCRGKGLLRAPELSEEDAEKFGWGVNCGDRIIGWATWHLPRNYQNPGSADRVGILSRRGILLVGRVKSYHLLDVIPGGCGNPFITIKTVIHRRVQESLEPLKLAGKDQEAAILASLIIGYYSALDRSTREVFQNCGTYHALVVSGLHVACIAGLLLHLFSLLHLPDWISRSLVALAILLYTWVVGFQASITRCLWMFILYLAGKILFRRADPVNVLSASGLLLLAIYPHWLFDVGFQLSFLSVLAIALTAVPIINKNLRPFLDPLQHAGNPKRLFLQRGRMPRLGRYLRFRSELFIEACTDPLPFIASRILIFALRKIAKAGFVIGSMILVSFSVQLWIEPLLAHNFNRLSWISPLANLAIVPLSSLVLTAGMATALTGNIPYCGTLITGLAGWLSSLLLRLTIYISDIPNSWQRCPTPSLPWVLAGILLLFIWSFFERQRLWIPFACIILLLACLSFSSLPPVNSLAKTIGLAACNKDDYWSKQSEVLSFSFLDVGEGDSVVIQFPNRQVWVLDAGGIWQAPSQEGSENTFDIGEAVVSRYLWWSWITKIDRLLLSHPDQDHAGGMQAVINNFKAQKFYYSGIQPNAILDRTLNLVQAKMISTNQIHAGEEEKVGGVRVRTLHPPDDGILRSTNENSLVLHLKYKRFSALLTGDLGQSGEAEILSFAGNIRSLLLKVAHHGSHSSTRDDFLDRIQSRWAVISAGQNNPHGHPSREVLLRLHQHGVRPILTIDEGTITVETDGTRYVVKTYVSGILEEGSLPD